VRPIRHFARPALVLAASFFSAFAAISSVACGLGASSNRNAAAAAYLGFDTNNYPGDAVLGLLRRTFSFTGYWLNSPPGGATVSWSGKRKTLRAEGFGFLALFNGRAERELGTPKHAAALGLRDARAAANAAMREDFPLRTVIFLDQEEGGEMEPNQMAYLLAWIDGVSAAHFRAGVYCSGMPAAAGPGRLIVTAQNIREHAGKREVTFFIYDDACPPAPGCVYSRKPPAPAQSGVPFASVWQFAQSPRRHEFTARCTATYDRDGNCYAPNAKGANSIFLDLDSSTSPDPSHGR
jgi:hypothetical protein